MKAWNQTTRLKRTNGVMFSPKRIAWFAVVVLAAVTPLQAQTPLGSGFTYQGKLDLQGSPLDGTADFEFTLWDADVTGNMIDAVVPVSNVTVVDGQFTVKIDFGVIAFNGDKRWLEIAVASPSGGALTTLSPRQPLTAAPYALQTRGIFVDDTGNVGIGTTTPTESLHISGGDLLIEASSSTNTKSSSLTIGGRRINGGNTAGAYALLQFQNRDGDNSNVNYVGASIRSRNREGNSGPGSDDGDLRFATAKDLALVEHMIITNEGNVGIGTNAPSTKLEVDGIVTATAFVGDGSGLTGISADDADADPANELQTLAGVLGQGNDAGGADMVNLGTVNAAAFSSNSPLQLQTAGTTRIYVDDVTGNVGIGNSNPNAKLKVTGTEVSQSTLLLNYTGFFSPGNYPPALRIDGGGYDSIAGSVTGIEVDLSGATAPNKYAAIFKGGNVGIGTTSPGRLLTLQKNGSAASIGIDIHNLGTNAADESVIAFETQG
ncbi:MAG: hypothetical protein IH986_11045, partial [Planctomycetes bacterium]|nr:hypothetical protein [Planctomycetota bacterium]